MRRLQTGAISLLAAFVLALSTPAAAAPPALGSESSGEYTGLTYSSFDLDVISEISDISVNLMEDSLALEFMSENEVVSLSAKEFSLPVTGNASGTRSFASDGVDLQLLPTGDITGQFFQSSHTLDSRAVSFTLLKTTSQSRSTGATGSVEIQRALESTQASNATLFEGNIKSQEILESKVVVPQATSRATYKTVSVYKSGLSVPFLISGGFSQGWVDVQNVAGSIRPVTNFKYNVAYNWPSDGIILWRNYQASSPAISSGAWPKGGVQKVPGTWQINLTTGKLDASTTVSALAKGVPIMWTLYDVKNLG